jgi:hypothetical protein
MLDRRPPLRPLQQQTPQHHTSAQQQQQQQQQQQVVAVSVGKAAAMAQSAAGVGVGQAVRHGRALQQVRQWGLFCQGYHMVDPTTTPIAWLTAMHKVFAATPFLRHARPALGQLHRRVPEILKFSSGWFGTWTVGPGNSPTAMMIG